MAQFAEYVDVSEQLDGPSRRNCMLNCMQTAPPATSTISFTNASSRWEAGWLWVGICYGIVTAGVRAAE